MSSRFRYFFVLAFSAWLFAAVGGCSSVKSPADEMPDKLAGLERVRLITGQEALDRVNDLHGKPLDIAECAIGVYGHDDQPATVWISRADKASDSNEQALAMVDRMQSSEGPFTGPEKLTAEGVTIYKFKGMGQEHYVFTKGDLAYWVSAPPKYGSLVLQDFF